ncbi:MAG TPA: ABC transporter ATP-binding protein [Solirubrobacteraceae bacterium]|jgi:iron(III) transport system ATP-binding protein|nr:ABC transporter ATP-binding protein [Solirubrobacteraceae bacterium]
MADLECRDLRKAYGDRVVLTDVDLTVAEGTLTAILGSSGSGKTTLLRIVIGFIAPDAGVVSIGGTTVTNSAGIHVPPDKRAIGYVAQEGALFPHLTVAENIGFGLPRDERKRGSRIGEALDLVGLAPRYAQSRPHELSGGEQRRVALARALAPRPALVLLDEPFSGLDAALRGETRAAVLDALAATGSTAVLVTHDQGEALSTGREVAVLRDGRLVQTAAPKTLYRTPADLDLARFVGDAVVVTGEARGGTVICTFGALRVRGEALAGPVAVMIRPEQIRVDRTTTGGGVAARVVQQSFYGAETVLQLELADGSATRVTARTFDAAGAELGAEVRLIVDGPVATYPPTAGEP